MAYAPKPLVGPRVLEHEDLARSAARDGDEETRGLSLFGGASSEVRRCNCSVVVLARASFLPEIYLSIYLSIPAAAGGVWVSTH